jgi:hypothetical protein
MDKYIPVDRLPDGKQDLNQVRDLKEKDVCFHKVGNDILPADGYSIYLEDEYYRLNPEWKEPEKSCYNCGVSGLDCDGDDHMIPCNKWSPKKTEKSCDNCDTMRGSYLCYPCPKYKKETPPKGCNNCGWRHLNYAKCTHPEYNKIIKEHGDFSCWKPISPPLPEHIREMVDEYTCDDPFRFSNIIAALWEAMLKEVRSNV